MTYCIWSTTSLTSCFNPLKLNNIEVADRSCETQLEVGENLNYIIVVALT